MPRITPADPTTADDERELLALAVAERNGRSYCLSAHSVSAEAAGTDAGTRADARRFVATDARQQAILALTEALLVNRAARTELDVPRVDALASA